MSNVRWSLALFAGFVAACGSPGTALAPSGEPLGEAANLTVRPVFTIAALLLEPTELRGLVAQPYSVVRSESGEQRIRQVLTSAMAVKRFGSRVRWTVLCDSLPRAASRLRVVT